MGDAIGISQFDRVDRRVVEVDALRRRLQLRILARVIVDAPGRGRLRPAAWTQGNRRV
jgi:hypothetical protein